MECRAWGVALGVVRSAAKQDARASGARSERDRKSREVKPKATPRGRLTNSTSSWLAMEIQRDRGVSPLLLVAEGAAQDFADVRFG